MRASPAPVVTMNVGRDSGKRTGVGLRRPDPQRGQIWPSEGKGLLSRETAGLSAVRRLQDRMIAAARCCSAPGWSAGRTRGGGDAGVAAEGHPGG